MTGAQIKDKYNIKLNEVGSGYQDDDTINNILADANINVVDKKVQEYARTLKITTEMQPLINFTSPISPISSTVNVSSTSLTVVDYYRFIAMEVTCPYRDGSITRWTKERPFDQFQSNFTAGSARYPRHYFTNNIVTIEPSDVTSCRIVYFKKPIVIDVTDNVTEIGYNDKLIQLLIDEAMIITGIAGRDQMIVQNSTIQEQKNP